MPGITCGNEAKVPSGRRWKESKMSKEMPKQVRHDGKAEG